MNLYESFPTPPTRAPLLLGRTDVASLGLAGRFESTLAEAAWPQLPARLASRDHRAAATRRILETTWRQWQKPAPDTRTLTIVAGGRG